MRNAFVVVSLVTSAAVATAEPIAWGYRVVDATTGQLRGERAGVSDPWLSFLAVSRAGASFENQEASNNSRVTIIDELTGAEYHLGVSWNVKQQWDRRFDDKGQPYWDWTSEWEEQTRIVPGGWRPDGGRTLYTIGAEGGSVFVEVDVLTTATTPEPGTLVLCGVAAVGGFGAWVRKRRRA